jgi:hypothetical protein
LNCPETWHFSPETPAPDSSQDFCVGGILHIGSAEGALRGTAQHQGAQHAPLFSLVKSATSQSIVFSASLSDVATHIERWPHTSEQIPISFKWILRGQAAWAEGRGSESKYTTSGVRACRLECGLRVL